jgi:hypothetical protein
MLFCTIATNVTLKAVYSKAISPAWQNYVDRFDTSELSWCACFWTLCLDAAFKELQQGGEQCAAHSLTALQPYHSVLGGVLQRGWYPEPRWRDPTHSWTPLSHKSPVLTAKYVDNYSIAWGAFVNIMCQYQRRYCQKPSTVLSCQQCCHYSWAVCWSGFKNIVTSFPQHGDRLWTVRFDIIGYLMQQHGKSNATELSSFRSQRAHASWLSTHCSEFCTSCQNNVQHYTRHN